MTIKLTDPNLPGVEIYFLTITPGIAQEFLDNNADNQRSISAPSLDRYAQDIASDSWVFTGDPIRFAKSGKLIDGQHRLKAIVESEQSLQLLIVTGLDEDSIMAIDTGRKRSFSDILKITYKFPHHVSCAAIAVRYFYWINGNYGSRNMGRVANSAFLNAVASNAQLDKVIADLEESGVSIVKAAEAAARVHQQMPRGITKATWGLLWLILSESGRDVFVRDRFWFELCEEPASPRADYSINALKNKIMRLDRRTDGDWDHVKQLHFAIRTYNAWRSGEAVSYLKMPTVVRHDTLAMPIINN